MSPLLYLTTTAIAITLVACKPAPRYTLTEATDPKTGTRTAYRLNTETGASEALQWVEPTPGHTLRFWEPIHEQRTALEVLKAYKNANEANAKQAAEIKAGTFTY